MNTVNRNGKRIRNADILAAITKEPGHEAVLIANILHGVKISNDEDAKTVRVEEESLFLTVFSETSRQVYPTAKSVTLASNRTKSIII